jgi:ribosomal protein S14
MRHFLARDKRRRVSFLKFEFKRVFLKSIYYNCFLDFNIRERARLELLKLPKNSSRSRLHNRCVFTRRSGGVLRFFKISRMVFRDLSSRGFLYGIRKSGKL